ncbi:hypothetical protein FOZ62_009158, partial [Perkinsus olseni]
IPEMSGTIDRIREEGLQTEASIEEVVALDRTLLSDATTDIEKAFPYTKVQRSVLGKTITIDAGIGFGARRCEDTQLNGELSYRKTTLAAPTCLGGDQPCDSFEACGQSIPLSTAPISSTGDGTYEPACDTMCQSLNDEASYC